MSGCFRQDGSALIYQQHGETVRIEPWGADSVRVRATRLADVCERCGTLLPQPPAASSIAIGEHSATLRNGDIEVQVSSHYAVITYRNARTGKVLMEEVHPARIYTSVGGERWKLQWRIKANDGERFYGLGQHRNGLLDQKGCVIELRQMNTEVAIPFAVSSRGYGVLWHNPAVGRVELANNLTRWVADRSAQFDYWVTAADTVAGILERYTAVTGRPPMLPKWAAGFWQSKLRYKTQEELLSVAREYKRRGLPLSVIVIDYFHWTMMGDWKFNPVDWPDPSAMVRELEQMGVRPMVSVWPALNPNSENAREMARQGLLICGERGEPVHKGMFDVGPAGRVFLHFYDNSHPKAREFLWDKVRQNYYSHGIRVFWLDACEPQFATMHHDNLRMYAGNAEECGCMYPFWHTQGMYEGMKSQGQDDIVMVPRCGWAGSQRFGAAIWSGDVPSTFEEFRIQLKAGLNMAASGIFWWNTDIGGFKDGDGRSPEFRELLVRWFQWGVFQPICRLHGVRRPETPFGGADNEIWSFGEEVYGHLKQYLLLRYRLGDYILRHMRIAHEKGLPIMRPLFFDFQHDQAAWTVDDAYMFGSDLLVAPVMSMGARRRSVYLPKGASWTDAWTGQRHVGGTSVEVEAPLDRIPLFLRDGAELPIRQ
jgi:alpha-D-xyloside xylohydrolase